MIKIMIAGDTHGDLDSFSYLIKQSQQYGVNKIIVLGDFGHWEPYDNGEMYYCLQTMLERAQIDLLWIDGNHEQHSHLRTQYINPYYFLKYLFPDQFESELVPIRPNIFHIPRGAVFEFDGVRFIGLGGAYSPDKNSRKIGYNFFWEETITDSELEYAASKENIDILLTHDVPSNVDLGFEFWKQYNAIFKSLRETELNRNKVQKLFDVLNPKYLFHGHYHMKYQTKLDGAVICGLDCNGSLNEQYRILSCDHGNIYI